MARVAVVILTHNEELHLGRALSSVLPFTDEYYVVDSGSTDATLEIAQKHGAHILHHKWKNYADQFQWALETIPSKADWIMRLDADEIVEDDLAHRIRTELPKLPDDVVGINIDRKHIFMGRWIRHGGRYPLTLLRLWRRGHGRIEQRWMDEHIIVQGGKTVHFAGGFADHNLNDLSFFTAKHNKYATREAIDVINQRYALFERDRPLSSAQTSAQTAFKRWVKEEIYNRIPFWVSALAYFMFRYVGQAGFLDGKEGLIYHFLQGFWYRFLVGAKVYEYERELKALASEEDKCARLEALTGLSLS